MFYASDKTNIHLSPKPQHPFHKSAVSSIVLACFSEAWVKKVYPPTPSKLAIAAKINFF